LNADSIAESNVDQWLQALPNADSPCGPDLEYDNAFLELSQAAVGKAETQFDSGAPPDWRDVRERAETLLGQSRDLRIAVYWLRALVHLEGMSALAPGLRLLHELLARFWEPLHPVLDDGDAYARMNALGILSDPTGLIGDLRSAVLFRERGIGELRGRAFEIALNLLQAKEEESVLSRDQIGQMLADIAAKQPLARNWAEAALSHLKTLISFVNERVGIENAPDLKPLFTLLKAISGLIPAAAAPTNGDDQSSDDDGGAATTESTPTTTSRSAGQGGRLSGGIGSRDDAVKALDMICEFLERTEPTNPAPLLLRRAKRMINRNFLQLMKELAPDALPEVARLMGVDPDSIDFGE
jgi:type VI secretion system protein ImpA